MRLVLNILRLVPVALLASTTAAAEVGSCRELNRIENLVGQVRSYSDGDIRVAHVDTGGEPACCAAHLLVFLPGSDPGAIQCFAVSDQAAHGSASARGFHSIHLDRMASSYDPQRGLLLTVPHVLYDGAKSEAAKPRALRIRIDRRGEGTVRIE